MRNWTARTYRLHTESTLQCCLQYKAAEYLVDCCTSVSDIPSRRHLRSATRHHLTVYTQVVLYNSNYIGLLAVPRYRLSTFGCQAFSVAGLSDGLEHAIPDSLRDPVLTSNTFRQSLKTNISSLSYSIADIDVDICVNPYIFREGMHQKRVLFSSQVTYFFKFFFSYACHEP